MGNQTEDSILIQSLQNGHAIEFERSDATRRLRLFLSELLSLMSQVRGLLNLLWYYENLSFNECSFSIY